MIKKRFKLVLYFCFFTAILIFAPLPFTGLANFTSQYQHWFHELSVEMSWKQSLLASENDTIFSIMARYTPLRLLDFTPDVTRIFQLIILALIGFIFIYLMYRGRNIKNSYVLETGFLTALIPLLSFTNHYAFQFIELAAFLIIFNFKKLSKAWRIAAIVGFTLTAINMHDLWGGAIWQFLNEISLVAIGAIIVQAILIEFRMKRVA